MLDRGYAARRVAPALVASYGFRGLELLPQRAVWRPTTRTLFIADAHLGKAATFRTLGLPVPKGTTQDNLARIGALVDCHGAAHIVFLGDLFHARQAHTPSVARAFHEWRSRRADLRLTLVRGNHDSRAGDPPASLGVEIVDEPYATDDVEGRHHPLAPEACLDVGATVLAGHLHPVARLYGPGRDSLRAPCFVLHGRQIILPAFGAFTGGCVTSAPGQRICAPDDASLVILPV